MSERISELQAGILQKVAKLTKGLVPIDPSRSDIKREKIAELRAGRASGVKGGEKWGPSVTSHILPRFLHFPSVTFAPFVTLGKVGFDSFTPGLSRLDA